MRRRRPLIAEFLEQRSLLSSLSYSLTTNQSVYQVGTPIQISFKETNTGSQPVTVTVAPADFTVSQNGSPIWQDVTNTTSLAIKLETLQPGQSISQTASWNGTTSFSLGVSNITSIGSRTWQINRFGTFSVSIPNEPQATGASFQITNPVTYSLTTDKQVYQLGDPVQATFTEVNTASQSITIFASPPQAFDVYQNGNPLWFVAYPQVLQANPIVLSAGQTITATQSLNIIPHSGPYTLNNLTGTFDATYGPQNDPTQYSTPFQVEAPVPDDLATSVTTDQSTYTIGQPVNLTFSETNNGTQPIVVLTGPTSFQISQNGTTIWNSTPSLPLASQRLGWTTLQPGQTYSQTATWNGLPNVGTISGLTGPFTVTDELDPNPDTASFQFTAPASTQLSTSLTTDKSVYELGQPIQLTFKETNQGTTPIQVATGPASFSITQNGSVIWNSSVSATPPTSTSSTSITWITLQAGQSYTQTATWNGVPEKLPSGYSGGTFTVTNALDASGQTATFQITAQPAADLSTKVTTDKSVYDYGQPIQLTFTATNVTSQPIEVLTGPTAFSITHGGTVYWVSANPNTLSSSTSWETLQPGQSYTQTLKWGGTNISAVTSTQATGQFAVSDLLDPNGSSASFQIVAPPSPPTPITNPTPPTPTPPTPTPPTPILPKPIPQQPVAPTNPLPVTANLVANHGSYKSGQTIGLALTLKNTSAATVTVAPNPSVDGITVTQGSSVIFRSSGLASALAARTIKPHGSIKLALDWSGHPNQSGIKTLPPGTYTIKVVQDGFSATATIRIVGGG